MPIIITSRLINSMVKKFFTIDCNNKKIKVFLVDLGCIVKRIKKVRPALPNYDKSCEEISKRMFGIEKIERSNDSST